MFNTDQLEEMVLTIANQAARSSERIREEYFAETIEQKLQELPNDCRDEFMLLASLHGYKSPAERSCDYSPEADGFNGAFYDDLFPLKDSDWTH